MKDAQKVLVVDDDFSIREIIKMVLGYEGFEVSELDNGHQINKAIETLHPDVILLDVMLGDMDGRDICRQLKSVKSTAGIPVIIISASHGRYSMKEKSCAANDYIAKPFDISELISKVRSFTSKV